MIKRSTAMKTKVPMPIYTRPPSQSLRVRELRCSVPTPRSRRENDMTRFARRGHELRVCLSEARALSAHHTQDQQTPQTSSSCVNAAHTSPTDARHSWRADRRLDPVLADQLLHRAGAHIAGDNTRNSRSPAAQNGASETCRQRCRRVPKLEPVAISVGDR
jgi:hypothetical protein